MDRVGPNSRRKPPYVTRSPASALQRYNEDDSIDLYVSPDAPKGLESNHLKMVGDDGWFIYFRRYAPGQSFFDKTFKLDDFERVTDR